MGTLRCDGCGEEFIVFHDPTFVDKAVADATSALAGKGSRRGTRTGTKAPGSNPTAGLGKPHGIRCTAPIEARGWETDHEHAL